MTPLRILVLKGGDSSEREVSLSSGGRVTAALRARGHVPGAIRGACRKESD